MYTVDIDETTEVGRDILHRIAENPAAGRVRNCEIPFDGDLDDFPLFTEEELNRTRAEILAENPEGANRILTIPRDENGNPVGYTLDEVFADVDKTLSNHFGIDFAKVNRRLESGELDNSDITNELLLSPEFEYKRETESFL